MVVIIKLYLIRGVDGKFRAMQKLIDELEVANESGLIYTVISSAVNIQKVKEWLNGSDLRKIDFQIMPDRFDESFQENIFIIPTKENLFVIS